MAVTKDAVTAPAGVTATSLTFAHTCTGSNLALAVSVATADVAGVTGVTYNGVSMTSEQTLTNTNNDRLAMFKLEAPATGSNNVVITNGSSTNILGSAYSVTGADQTDCTSNSGNARGTSNSPSVTIASAAGELVLAAVNIDANINISAGTGETEEWDVTGSTGLRFAGYSEAGAASVTINPSMASSNVWAIAALSFKAAAAGGAAVQPSLMLMGVGP